MDLLVGTDTGGKVLWLQNEGNSWEQHKIAEGYGSVEGVNASYFNGQLGVVVLDQGGNLFDLAVTSENQWEFVTLDNHAKNAQKSIIVDVDSDGDNDIVYTCESEGLFWMEYLGGSIADVSNWEKHMIDNLIGAWWIADEIIDYDEDGQIDDMVVSARTSSYTKKSPNPGLYVYELENWDGNKIADIDPLVISTGDFDGDGDNNDIVTGNRADGNAYLFRMDSMEKLYHGPKPVRSVGTVKGTPTDLVISKMVG